MRKGFSMCDLKWVEVDPNVDESHHPYVVSWENKKKITYLDEFSFNEMKRVVRGSLSLRMFKFNGESLSFGPTWKGVLHSCAS